MKRLISSVLALTFAVIGFSAVSAVFAYGDITDKNIYTDSGMTSVSEHNKNRYSTNKNGQTYGSGLNVTYIEDLPDLISVVGDNGKVGYVYANDFFGKAPSSPEEAIKIQETLKNGTYVPEKYNVYASDGETIIDTFTEKTE